MRKLLISDYDDTLFTDEESLTKNLEKIKEFRENANIFVIATSRNFASIMEEIKKYNIFYDYLIVNVGAGLFDNHGKMIYSNFISNNERNEVEEFLKNYTKVEITRYGIVEEQPYASDKIVGYKIKGDLELLEEINEILKKNLNNFEIILKKEEKKLFLNHKDNTKEKAVEKLIKLFPEYKNYKILVVGDDNVDYEMIKKYDGYRMKNSSELLVKNISKFVNFVGELI